MKKVIFGFVLGLFVMGSIAGVVALNYNAKEIGFTSNDSSWNVNNVEDALKDLKKKKDGSVTRLLWTNDDLTTAFLDQTINLDLSNYDKVLINCKYSTGSYEGYYTDTQYSLIDVGASGHIKTEDDSVAYNCARTVDVTTTGITFGKSVCFGYRLSSSTDNTHALPISIYGIKINN